MKLESSLPEVVDIFKEIQEQPEQLYDMIRTDIRETIGQYLSWFNGYGAYAFPG